MCHQNWGCEARWLAMLFGRLVMTSFICSKRKPYLPKNYVPKNCGASGAKDGQLAS